MSVSARLKELSVFVLRGGRERERMPGIERRRQVMLCQQLQEQLERRRDER
jgi:hypothetical protein